MEVERWIGEVAHMTPAQFAAVLVSLGLGWIAARIFYHRSLSLASKESELARKEAEKSKGTSEAEHKEAENDWRQLVKQLEFKVSSENHVYLLGLKISGPNPIVAAILLKHGAGRQDEAVLVSGDSNDHLP